MKTTKTPEEFLKDYHDNNPNDWLFQKKDIISKLLEEYASRFRKPEKKVKPDLFFTELKRYFCDINVLNEWLQIRKIKKAVNTETALKGFLLQVEKSGLPVQDVVKMCVENSWKGFKADWIKNVNYGTIGKSNQTGIKQTGTTKVATSFEESL